MPRSGKKPLGSKEAHFWADKDLHERMTAVCHGLPINMADLVERCVRAHLPTIERNMRGRGLL